MVYTFDKEGIKDFKLPEVLVYNMGKVGSTSITETIMENGFRKTLKCHWMKYNYPIAEFWTERKYLMNAINSGKDRPFKIVIPVREPMARNISAFFQILPDYIPNYKDKDLKYLYRYFVSEYNVEYPDQWFHMEPMEVFGFDPYRVPFDTSVGYQIYKEEKHQYLIIRLEDCESKLTEALRIFLGVDNIQMKSSNVFEKTSRHRMQKEYAEFKKFRYNQDFLNRTYALEYVNHFYTKEEINKFRNKWSK